MYNEEVLLENGFKFNNHTKQIEKGNFKLPIEFLSFITTKFQLEKIKWLANNNFEFIDFNSNPQMKNDFFSLDFSKMIGNDNEIDFEEFKKEYEDFKIGLIN